MNRNKMATEVFVCGLLIIVTLLLFGRDTNADYIIEEVKNCGPEVNTAYGEYGASVSTDGLTLYFSDGAVFPVRPGGYGAGDIWVTHRQSLEGDWETPTNLGPTINTSAVDGCPCLTWDGLSLYFSSNRAGGSGQDDLYVSQRPDLRSSWEEPVNLGGGVNSSGIEIFPSVSSDRLSIYFCKLESGKGDIYVAKRSSIDEPFGSAQRLGSAINDSETNENCPYIMPDGRTLFFSRASTDGGVFLSRLADMDSAWGEPVKVSDGGWGSSMTADGTRVFFHNVASTSFGSTDLWEVKVLPVVDFDGDGHVDGKEVLTLTDHWGLDDPLCDIGPTAFGDGIVDLQDVIALSEYIGKDVNDPTLIAHWPLDETEGTTTREVVSGNDSFLFGEPVWEPDGGVVGGALLLDGIDDCVVPTFTYDPSDGPFSVIVWMKGGAPGQAILSEPRGPDWLSLDPQTGHLMTELTELGRTGGPLSSQAVIDDGNWHRTGLVWDGSNRILYVDQDVVAQDTQIGLQSPGNGLYIGCGDPTQSGTYFSGMIDDVRIYNRAVRP